MNVSFEKLNDVEGKIIVNVEESDYKAKVDSEIKRIGRTHNIPGFRKGHVPMGQLVRMFGKQVKSDVLNQEVYEAVVNYIRENKLGILGEPLPVENVNLVFDFPVCIAACAIAIVPTVIQGRFKKWQGYALLGVYALYMLLLVLNETGVVALG